MTIRRLVGQTKEVKVLADANVDVWLEGKIDRSLPDEQQQLSPEVRQLADQLKATRHYCKYASIPIFLLAQTHVVLQQLLVWRVHSWVHYS